MRLPTQDEVLASGRHVITFAAGGVTVFASLHLLTAGDAQSAADALNKIGSGFAEIITGLGTLAGIISAAFAALSANPLWQLIKGSRAVAANPEIIKQANVSDADQASVTKAAIQLPKVDSIVAAPEVANTVPSTAVQSSEDVKVVSK
jgi:hypothetical protein